MSYDLGNWWEKLKCDICNNSQTDLPPDFDLPPDYHDPAWDDPDPYGLTDPSPDPHDDGGLLDDFEIPSVPLPGDGSASPSWNDGPGFELEWPWG